MWKTTIGNSAATKTSSLVKDIFSANDDDWDTDADFVNTVSEKEQRWGSKSVQGSGRQGFVDIDKLRDDVKKDDEISKHKQAQEESSMISSGGYGGKYGVQNDRFDKSAVGFDYQLNVEKHSSQTDHSKGFGGKFGVLSDRKDASAVGYDHVESLQKHASQVDYAKGFGGKYGVETDKKDASAMGFDHVESLQKHASQIDYAKGFGGKYGVEKDKKDASAVGFDHVETLQKHASQVDYAKGFGGKYGVMSDRKDKSALGFDHVENLEKHSSQKDYAKGFGGKFGVEKDKMDKAAHKFDESGEDIKVGTNYQRTVPNVKANLKDLKSRFENRSFDEEAKKRSEQIRADRHAKDKLDKDMQVKEVKQEEPAQVPVQPQPVQRLNAPQPQQKQPVQMEQTKIIEVPVQKTPEPNDDDDWADNEKDVAIKPTYVAPDVYENSLAANSESVYVNDGANGSDGNGVVGEGVSAVALYDYAATDADEISFQPNNMITDIQMVDEGWWQGACNGKYGLFPANYVQILQK